MTKLKKLTSIVACAVMAVSSMATLAINTSAAYTNADNAIVSDHSIDVTSVNPNHVGTYYNGTSFVQISSSECNLYNVSYGGYSNICGYTSSFSVGTTGSSFTATLPAGQWFYYNSSGNIVHGTSSLIVSGSYSAKGTISIGGVTYTK